MTDFEVTSKTESSKESKGTITVVLPKSRVEEFKQRADANGLKVTALARQMIYHCMDWDSDD